MFFFFKQKTAYAMRISDWSSDVCASDLHIEYAIGQAGLLEQTCDQQRWRGVAFGGLEHEAVAAGQRHREHPHRYHAREVERGDAGTHAERGIPVVGVDVAADVHRVLALEQMREDRKSVVWGRSVSVRVDIGGRLTIKKK